MIRVLFLRGAGGRGLSDVPLELPFLPFGKSGGGGAAFPIDGVLTLPGGKGGAR